MFVLSHKRKKKNPTVSPEQYFRQACGTARFAYNWGLDEWKKQYEAGKKPTVLQIKKAFNAIKPVEFPWVFNSFYLSNAENRSIKIPKLGWVKLTETK